VTDNEMEKARANRIVGYLQNKGERGATSRMVARENYGSPTLHLREAQRLLAALETTGRVHRCGPERWRAATAAEAVTGRKEIK